ncbi:invasion associated locus B family protein [Allorhizobium ampelinum]|uniref:invasion associated locus B family protein n=1 Tax=Allorhizobium ampelinum TaxID=3025782 RepID=UPI001F1AEC10|nr:invasion associated locus B family protein [Allorhizobium ampelinum]
MRRIAFGVAMFASLASAAWAEQETDAGAKSETNTLIPALASVTAAGEAIIPGDVISMSRTYLGGWSLKCDLRLSKDQRVCVLDQVLRDGDNLALWRVAQTAEGKPIVVVSMPASFDPASGLTLSFSGLDKTIPGSDWRCGASGCISAFPFSGILASAVTASDHVRFSYSLKAVDGKTTPAVLTATMQGFSQVLDASKNPFGKTVAAKEEPKKPEKQKATSSKPKTATDAKKPNLY